MQKIQITDTLSVAAQPEPSDLASLAAEGFTLVVCNRPDGESEGQPDMDTMEAAAKAAGMEFMRYPVNPTTFPGPDLAAMGAAFDAGNKVFAYCRTGTRSTNLWVASRNPDQRGSAADHARALGFDLSLSDRLA